MREALPAEYARLVQADGSVVVPGAVADGVLRLLVLGVTRASQRNAGGRPTDSVLEVLHALNQAAVKAAESSTSGSGSDIAEKRTMITQDGNWMDSKEAAALLDCTDRAIRLACGQGRLYARKTGRQWMIHEKDLDTYRFGTTSHGKQHPGGTRHGC